MSDGYHGVCEKCGKRASLCLFRSDVLTSIDANYNFPSIQTYAVALCGNCAEAAGLSRWFESLPVTPIEAPK